MQQQHPTGGEEEEEETDTKQPGGQREFLPDDGSAFFSLRKSICDRNQYGPVIAQSCFVWLFVCLFFFSFPCSQAFSNSPHIF
jgi:hypothetical protein